MPHRFHPVELARGAAKPVAMFVHRVNYCARIDSRFLLTEAMPVDSRELIPSIGEAGKGWRRGWRGDLARRHGENLRKRLESEKDRAWVEQKNGAVVRRLTGYGRLSGLAAAGALQRLYDSPPNDRSVARRLQSSSPTFEPRCADTERVRAAQSQH